MDFKRQASLKGGAGQPETRQALLEAGGAVFAERGFQGTTIRDICRRAGTNVAAVNYHFGDKAALYREVLRYSHVRAMEKYPLDLGVSPQAPATERLRAFIRSFLLRIFDAGPTAWHAKLIMREMIHPTGALDRVVEERFRPIADHLTGILRELLGSRAPAETLRLCAASIVSQCVFYHHCRPVISRLFPEIRLDMAHLDALADHITRFSLAGLERMAGVPTGRRRRPSTSANT